MGTNAVVVTDAKGSPAISLGTAHVYGSVDTGPGGTVSVGGSGSAGDAAWNASSSGIEPGWSDDTMNVSFPSNSPPAGLASFLAGAKCRSSPHGGSNVLPC